MAAAVGGASRCCLLGGSLPHTVRIGQRLRRLWGRWGCRLARRCCCWCWGLRGCLLLRLLVLRLGLLLLLLLPLGLCGCWCCCCGQLLLNSCCCWGRRCCCCWLLRCLLHRRCCWGCGCCCWNSRCCCLLRPSDHVWHRPIHGRHLCCCYCRRLLRVPWCACCCGRWPSWDLDWRLPWHGHDRWWCCCIVVFDGLGGDGSCCSCRALDGGVQAEDVVQHIEALVLRSQEEYLRVPPLLSLDDATGAERDAVYVKRRVRGCGLPHAGVSCCHCCHQQERANRVPPVRTQQRPHNITLFLPPQAV